MIFAFDFPREENGIFYRPYEHTKEYTYNGLINYKGDYPCYGPAPPSLTDILEQHKVEFEIVKSSDICSTDKSFYYLLETQGPPEGWLGTYKNYTNTILSGVSEQIIEAAQKRQCKIILFSSNEGYDPFQYKIFDKINQDIEKYGIPHEQFIFISGNLIIDTLYDVWKKTESRSYGIKCIPFNNELFDEYEDMQPNVKYDKECNNRDKKFLLLNRQPRIHRIALISLLHSKGLLKDTLTSFPSEDLSPAPFSKKVHISQYFGRMLNFDDQTKSDCLMAWKDLEENHFPLIVDVEEWDTNHYGTSVDWLYDKTFLSIVVESIYDDLSVFLDEKIWKPIYNYHPFIMVGCPNSLKKLKELGFKTFHPFIDESYDSEHNHGKRLLMISDEIKKIHSKSNLELKKWYTQLTPILEHNKNKLLPWSKDKKNIIRNFIREIQ